MDMRHEGMRIGGHRVVGDRVIEVVNPYSGACIGTVPQGTADDVRRAFGIAAAYRPRLSRYDRHRILMRAAEMVVARTEEISDLITAESGLCKKDTRHEVGRVRDVLMFGANATLVDDGQVFACDVTPHGRERRVYTQRDPLRGVIAAITPFNHPMNQVAHKVVPAVATNNRMVLKPSEKVPLSAVLFADILYAAGLPPEMFQVVTGEPAEIADELLTNPVVDLVTFTGGVSVGKAIAEKIGYRRSILELGGNDPLVVFEDADPTQAAALAADGSFKNSGQRCTAVKRVLVQDSIADRFVDLLSERALRWRYGDPADEAMDMGTVIDEPAARVIEARVDEAIARGARLRCGNLRRGALYAPTVLDRVTPDMTLVREETFGPVAPVIRFGTVDEAIAIVNGSGFGLSSGVCTNRLDLVTRLVNELQVGSINVGEVPGYRLELTPFGGIKDSGLGHKEGVLEAIKGYTNVKTYSLPWPLP